MVSVVSKHGVVESETTRVSTSILSKEVRFGNRSNKKKLMTVKYLSLVQTSIRQTRLRRRLRPVKRPKLLSIQLTEGTSLAYNSSKTES